MSRPMRSLRYAQSGHQKRVEEAEALRLARAAAPSTKARLVLVAISAIAPAVLALGLSQRTRLVVEETVHRVLPAVAVKPPPPAPAPPPAAVAPVVDDTVHDTLRAGEALSAALARHGVGANDVSDLVRDLKGVLDVRALRAGAPFSVKREGNKLARFTFRTTNGDGVPRTITAVRLADPLAAPSEAAAALLERPGLARTKAPSGPRFGLEIKDAKVSTRLEGISGSITTSLYDGVLDAGGDAKLVNKFVDVFAWNVDFYRQTQRGDEFLMLVEKRYAGEGADERFLGYGKVVAAEYVNAGTAFRGFAFDAKDGQLSGIFDENGDALERTFLKNPMEVARITSNYGMRFHPVLGRNKAHEGVDYGAPVGTPVWTVADGVVVEARYSKTAGNMIVVQHINHMTTEYFHLSRFADGIKAGARVKQKQVIGYVGSTGLSTGPHLHYGMRKHGVHVDPAKQKFPSAKPVPPSYRAEFDAFVSPLLAQLRALERA